MKVPELIKALKNAKHWQKGELTFWLGEDEIEIENMGQSGFDLTDINIVFKKVNDKKEED